MNPLEAISSILNDMHATPNIVDICKQVLKETESNPTGEAGGAHYGNAMQPFDLTRDMQSSGNAHVDGCRCAVIKYAFRIKGDPSKLIDDLKKAEHYAREAWQTLVSREIENQNLELNFESN